MPVYSVGTRRAVPVRAGASPRGVDLGNWQGLGPGNIGGRTRAFVIRPDAAHCAQSACADHAGASGAAGFREADRALRRRCRFDRDECIDPSVLAACVRWAFAPENKAESLRSSLGKHLSSVRSCGCYNPHT